MVDAERVVFLGREPARVGEPISAADGIARVEWVPMASVPGLIAAGRSGARKRWLAYAWLAAENGERPQQDLGMGGRRGMRPESNRRSASSSAKCQG